jgi:hypothetical protein
MFYLLIPFCVSKHTSKTNDPNLCLECARILEAMESVADTEAASLYEKGGQFDKAAVRIIDDDPPIS